MTARAPESVVKLALDLDVTGNFAFQPHTIVVDGGTLKLTLCNCYLSVFMAAMGCPVPPKKAAGQIAWLQSQQGKVSGWFPIDKETARQRANSGFPTIAAWLNPAPDAHSHIAPCVPAPQGDPAHLYVSAAGRENFVRCRLEESFGIVAGMLFFSHD